MLRGQEAITYLAERANDAEKSSSIHWREEFELFEVNENGLAQGASVLGNLSQKNGLPYRLAHWLLQTPFRYMGRQYKTFPEDLRLGKIMADCQDGRQFTLDILAQVLPYSLIREHVTFEDRTVFNLVTGDGYGMMTSLLMLMPDARRTITVNLTKSLVLDLVFTKKSCPSVQFVLVRDEDELAAAMAEPAIDLIAIQADNAEVLRQAPLGLAINIASMQEMEPAVIENYFDIMRRNRSEATYFYCCNRVYKQLSDGTELKFQDYPWLPDDEILVDEACAWRNLSYRKTPPFWQKRHGDDRILWHRLVRMAS